MTAVSYGSADRSHLSRGVLDGPSLDERDLCSAQQAAPARDRDRATPSPSPAQPRHNPGGRDRSHCVTITPGPPSSKFHDDRGNLPKELSRRVRRLVFALTAGPRQAPICRRGRPLRPRFEPSGQRSVVTPEGKLRAPPEWLLWRRCSACPIQRPGRRCRPPVLRPRP